ncbi:hypothetical protein H072_988 [Dactylellina haptotyla CBS 200.50]|uniref:Uncharacterized protein n=1 Tax=Dactylellina haptotyla (strain CBS 200.50) TaxID=1284197 RepID=S8AVH0_DACHA|nr:hypothetical protein H072_988 [Dactylellina haptotyla CBS 200.50]
MCYQVKSLLPSGNQAQGNPPKEVNTKVVRNDPPRDSVCGGICRHCGSNRINAQHFCLNCGGYNG